MPARLEKTAEQNLRRAVVDAARHLSLSGLSPGRSGNVSARWPDGMLITASGIAAHAMTPEADVVFVDGEGGAGSGQKRPSSEWPFHQAIYRARPDIHAVVHCHSLYATALACAHKPIPPFHYMVAKAKGSGIPLAPYATYGTQELAAHAAAALADRDACLLANHGQIAIGATLEAAMELAEEVEFLAAQYAACISIGGAQLLDEAEMQRVAAKLKTYGQPGKHKSRV